MRAVAVISVFLTHTFGWPEGGFVGVDVFFVLSGFFITSLLLEERINTGGIDFRRFYVRRVRRIVPAATLVLAVTVAASFVIVPASRARETFIDALWAFVFVANWRFERTGTDYFEEGQPPSPLQHYWSLSIEEQFYFIWPLIILLCFAITRKRRRRLKKRDASSAVLFAIVPICLMSFAYAAYLSMSSNSNAAYFSTLTRVWELGVGAILAVCAPWISRTTPAALRVPMAYVGLAGLFVAFIVIRESWSFPAPWAILPTLSTALVIASFVGAPVRSVGLLTNPVACYFGDRSYTLYLWHWPVVVLTAYILPPGTVYYVAVIALSLAITHLTYKYFEDPIRRSNWMEHPDRKIVVGRRKASFSGLRSTFIVGVVLVICAALTMAKVEHDERFALGESQEELDFAPIELQAEANCFGAAAAVDSSCQQVAVTANDVTPSLDRFADDSKGGYGCFRGEGEELKVCSYGSQAEDATRVALVGDSHAAMVLAGLAGQLSENNWSLTVMVGNGCQWRLRDGADCSAGVQRMQDELLAGDLDFVIATGSRAHGGLPTATTRDQYVSTWRPLLDSGVEVVVVGDAPLASEESVACLTRLTTSDLTTCGDSRESALAIEDVMLTTGQATPGVTTVDLTDLFCDAERCPNVIGGVVVYRDAAGHISATYSKTVAPILVDRITNALSG